MSTSQSSSHVRGLVAGLRADADAYHAALQEIKDTQGKVCDEYETCTHRACQSSYAAWAIADKALRR